MIKRKDNFLVAHSTLKECIDELEIVAEELYYLTHCDIKNVFREVSLGTMCLYKERIDEMISELESLADRVWEIRSCD